MRVEPRQRLLELWKAAAEYSYEAPKWQWGGRDAENSISDAEQLLCLMYPASIVDGFRLDQPDHTASDVLEALTTLGDSVEIPKMLVRRLGEYLERYTNADGTPTFAGGSYFRSRNSSEALTAHQRSLDVVDSFSMSITLMLAAIGFVRGFRATVRRGRLLDELRAVEEAASLRLTAAMVGLMRSFSIQAFPAGSEQGEALVRTANQAGVPQSELERDLRNALRQVRAGLRDLNVGSGRGEVLDNDNLLFECGWSWGVIAGSPAVDVLETLRPSIAQPEGVAEDRPFLYFTVTALDGLEDLFSARTQILNLLNDEQQRIARLLQLRWELTQRYWGTVAMFGAGRWPLEDIPWRTTDGRESDYYSVLVSSVVSSELIRRRAVDSELGRVGEILRELAGRGRVTRRAVTDDPAIDLHVSGVELNLYGAEEFGPQVVWPVTDFSTALLKRSTRLATVARGTDLRNRLLDLSDDVWDHLAVRRIAGGPGSGLWDDPAQAFSGVESHHELPSWYLTERVAECLCVSAGAVEAEPLRGPGLVADCQDLLNEADHLYNQELLFGSMTAGQAMLNELELIGDQLDRAKELSTNRPGTAIAILNQVLLEIDRLVVARRRVTRSG
ncbi:SCO2524 family protein [Pseudofrankia inefficax]|uniref:Uncharacterized protein n=1 Tax=Pseudofrankia inefficax (strain DSM 45817 / CECT 9037 / DDB 130130 / EuI1c) TaxID=298654 RepID=E3IWE8_PSEI1|nr:SCO2524 family protein [Pseudofrankia inefficax]ADP80131.1 hypothetical protein FraEuI1c_2081 [Pseudofrankia inefficax]